MPPGSSAPGIEAALDVSLVLAGRRPQLVGLGLDVGLGLVGLGHRGGERRGVPVPVSDFLGFPLPGRTVWVTARFRAR